jgi:hypothetical protein
MTKGGWDMDLGKHVRDMILGEVPGVAKEHLLAELRAEYAPLLAAADGPERDRLQSELDTKIAELESAKYNITNPESLDGLLDL